MRGVVFLLLFLAACTTIDPIPYENTEFPIDSPDLRPDIPRTYVEEEVIEHEQPTVPETNILTEEVIPPYVALELPLGELMGHEFPIITVNQFPLLGHHAIPMGPSSYVSYVEEIIFAFAENTTGKIIFGKDDDKQISTFMFFEKDKPIFTYRLLLRGYNFYDLEGHEIQILGNTYIVGDVSNSSVDLLGVDVASNLFFSDGKKLTVMSNDQKDTLAFADPFGIGFTVFADGYRDDGNVLLSPGERLTDNMRGFANSVLDIMYEGMEDPQEMSSIRFDKTKYGYNMIFDSFDGPINLRLLEVDGGQMMLGQLDEPLRLDECSRGEYCIQPEDTLMFTTLDGRTFVASYMDASIHPDELIFHSGNNRYSYEYYGFPGENAKTDITINEVPFKAELGPFDETNTSANITVDFKQFRGFRRGEVDAILRGGFPLYIHDIVNNSLLVEIGIPRELKFDKRRDESIFVNISYDGEFTLTVIGNITFVDGNDNLQTRRDSYGLTSYGASIILDPDRRALPPNQGVELDIFLPYLQSTGNVRLEG